MCSSFPSLESPSFRRSRHPTKVLVTTEIVSWESFALAEDSLLARLLRADKERVLEILT
jgi:hypothetical protein